MSDTYFASVSRYQNFLDIIDSDWMADYLSDDDIDLPHQLDLPVEDDDVDVDEMENHNHEDEKWTDLCLDQLSPPE